MDYFEIMDFAGFDMEKANEIAKETIRTRELIEAVMKDAGLETLQSEPLRSERGRLRRARRGCRTWIIVVSGV